MSKELPYFKFYVNEWITGDITLEDYEVQGLFVNICAYYWSKDCDTTLTNIKRKFKDAKPEAFQSLIDGKVMKVIVNDKLVISFLDEQSVDREILSKTNSNNGKKGGRPRKVKTEIKPTALIYESEPLPEKSNIEEKRGEESIDDDYKETSTPFIFFTVQDFEQQIQFGENEFTLWSLRQTGKSLYQLKILREEFITAQKALTPNPWQSISDAKKHFVAWVKKQPTVLGYSPQMPGN